MELPIHFVICFSPQPYDGYNNITSMPVVPRGDKDAILNSIVDKYRVVKDHHHKKYRSGKTRTRKIRKYTLN